MASSKPFVKVFYAGLHLFDFNTKSEFDVWKQAACVGDYELYSGVYVHFDEAIEARRWYRADGTPVLLADVPKELLTWVLISE